MHNFHFSPRFSALRIYVLNNGRRFCTASLAKMEIVSKYLDDYCQKLNCPFRQQFITHFVGREISNELEHQIGEWKKLGLCGHFLPFGLALLVLNKAFKWNFSHSTIIAGVLRKINQQIAIINKWGTIKQCTNCSNDKFNCHNLVWKN